MLRPWDARAWPWGLERKSSIDVLHGCVLRGSGGLRRKRVDAGSADAEVAETTAHRLVRPIDIAQVDQDWLREAGLDPVEIEGAEGVPFRHDDERVRPLGTGIRILGVNNIAEERSRLFHALRVI